MIDVSQLKSAQIDVASLTAKVGAGLTQVEAVTALAQQGLVIPTGDVASVGVIGATLGGGLGLFTRSLGMASDFVTEAEIVVASPDSGAKAITADRLRQCAGRRTAGLATAYWGSNVDRLRRIKAKYDHDNIFQYEQSIPQATS